MIPAFHLKSEAATFPNDSAIDCGRRLVARYARWLKAEGTVDFMERPAKREGQLNMVTTRLMTSKELEVLPDDDYRYELFRGELIQMPPHDLLRGVRQARVGHIFLNYADRYGGMVTGEAGF